MQLPSPSIAKKSRLIPALLCIQWLATLLFTYSLLSISGCAWHTSSQPAGGLNGGYTLILPGIDTEHLLHHQLAAGLRDGGLDTHIEVYDWTTGNPGMMLWHLRWVERNKRQAQSVALKMIDYQMQYPDRPVHIVGHSAGAGIALMALENLPEHHQVDAVILLAACVSPEYDLTSALNRTKRGIYNYYSIVDAPLQVVGTTLAGTLDSQIGPAAGALGFRPPESLDAQGKKAYQRLFQRHFQTADFRLLNFGSHYGTLSRRFAKQEIAPRLVNNDYPTWNKD